MGHRIDWSGQGCRPIRPVTRLQCISALAYDPQDHPSAGDIGTPRHQVVRVSRHMNAARGQRATAGAIRPGTIGNTKETEQGAVHRVQHLLRVEFHSRPVRQMWNVRAQRATGWIVGCRAGPPLASHRVVVREHYRVRPSRNPPLLRHRYWDAYLDRSVQACAMQTQFINWPGQFHTGRRRHECWPGSDAQPSRPSHCPGRYHHPETVAQPQGGTFLRIDLDASSRLGRCCIVLRSAAARSLHQQKYDHQDGYKRQLRAAPDSIHRPSHATPRIPLAMDSPPLTAIGAVTRHISKQRLHWPRPAPQRYAQHERESTLCLWKLPFGISGWFDIPGGAARDPWGGFGQAPAHPPDPSAHGSRGAHCHRQFPAC